MSNFEHAKTGERLSRRQAAERLVDVAYALTAGGPLAVSAGGQRVEVPVARELQLDCELRSEDGQVALGLELSWPTHEPDPPLPPAGSTA